jgi:tetratricopeptide (TPR) repeat protein
MIWLRAVRVLAIAILAAGFAAAGIWSVRLAWADYWFRKQTLAGTRKALEITPGQAAYYYRLALLSSDDSPATAIEALKRAVTLNPADSLSWIELGLRYEAAGDNARAEQCLLRAIDEDAEYLPRWTLANYYFRRNDPLRFWFWAKQAAAMAYGDPLPLFRLCGQMGEDGNLIDRLAIRNPSLRASYLAYVAGLDRVDLLGPPTRRVLEENRESDTPLLLSVCDRLLERNRVDEALDIWNRLATARRIPFGARSPSKRSPLTNGSFTVAPTSQGFDWRLPEVDGVSAAREDSPGGLRLTFSGHQPERCEVLVQYVPVEEKRKYELRFLYRTSDIPPGTGLTWRVAAVNGAASLGEGKDLSAENETQEQLSFQTPAGCRLVRLSLAYQRSLGTTRIAGFIVLGSVDLVSADQPLSSRQELRHVRG